MARLILRHACCRQANSCRTCRELGPSHEGLEGCLLSGWPCLMRKTCAPLQFVAAICVAANSAAQWAFHLLCLSALFISVLASAAIFCFISGGTEHRRLETRLFRGTLDKWTFRLATILIPPNQKQEAVVGSFANHGKQTRLRVIPSQGRGLLGEKAFTFSIFGGFSGYTVS